jgi:hypothetical protein
VLDLCIAKGVDAAPAVRRQAAFATSDRRVRGAIMRLLRERGHVTRATLRRAIPDARVPRLVAALAQDGLIAERGGRVALP